MLNEYENNRLEEILKDYENKNSSKTAYAEFLRCKEDVRILLKAGHTMKSAYDIMKDKQKITMSYSQFCKYVSGKTVAEAGLRECHPRRKKNSPLAVRQNVGA